MKVKISFIILLSISLANVVKGQPGWSVDISGFENSMYISAELYMGNSSVTDTNTFIGVFHADECRGFSNVHHYENSDTYRASMQIYGNNLSEVLSIKVFDPVNNTTHDLDTTLIFEPNAILGNITTPVILRTDGVGIYSKISIDKELILFPNPCASTFQIETKLINGLIQVFNLQGKLQKQFPVNKRSKYDVSGLSPGSYIIVLQDRNSKYKASTTLSVK